MRRLLLFMLIVMITLLSSCSWIRGGSLFNTDKRILSKIERKYEKYKGYKCKASISIIGEEDNTMYLIEETYYKPNSYRFEILEPKESEGIIILNTNDKVYVEHPSINQSISLVTIKSLNNQLLIGGFFEDIYRAKRLSDDKIDGKEYLVFEYKLEDSNKYRETARIWLNKRDYIPYKLNIYDNNGALQGEIFYDNFKFLRLERKSLFSW